MTRIIYEKNIIRFEGNKKGLIVDTLVKEIPLTIYLNKQELVTLLCTPVKMDFLVLGFLFSEGHIKKMTDIYSLEINEEDNEAYVVIRDEEWMRKKISKNSNASLSCGKGTIYHRLIKALSRKNCKSELLLKPETIYGLMEELQKTSELYGRTGGVHSSALAAEKGFIFYSEDVGRHNTIDRLIGECIAKNIDMEYKIMVTSARLSTEIMLKAARAGIPFVLSRSAPTSLCAELANKLGITLIGFIRGDRMNIYSGEWRIVAN